jgi:hypothetical protein
MRSQPGPRLDWRLVRSYRHVSLVPIFEQPPPSGYVLIRILMQNQNDLLFRPIIGLGDQARKGFSQSTLSPDGQWRTFNDNRGHGLSLLLHLPRLPCRVNGRAGLAMGWRLLPPVLQVLAEVGARPASPQAGEQGNAHNTERHHCPFHVRVFLTYDWIVASIQYRCIAWM